MLQQRISPEGTSSNSLVLLHHLPCRVCEPQLSYVVEYAAVLLHFVVPIFASACLLHILFLFILELVVK